MNVATFFYFWLIALVLSIIQEGILLATFRKRLKFRLARIIASQVILMLVLFVFFFAGVAIDPIRSLAGRQTVSFLRKNGPHGQTSTLKRIKHVGESGTSGYFLYELHFDGTSQILKTTYQLTDETTVFKTEIVEEDISGDKLPRKTMGQRPTGE